MEQTSATDAILLFRDKLKLVVDPFYDAISSLENGIVTAYQSCEKEFQKNFNPNTKNPDQQFDSETSSEQQQQENLNKAAQYIADLYEDNCNSKELTVPDEGKKLIYDNALHLYEKIGEGLEDQKERKLITLLHRHRVASINNILKDDAKNEEEKLDDINKILNDSNYDFNHSLDDNIFWLAQNINKSTFLLEGPSNISEKTSKEELLFRLNDFGYSCLGVLASGADKVNKIEALKALYQEESTADYAKKYLTTKKNIQSKIEKGARVVEAELVKLGFEADKTILANGVKETPDIKQQIISGLLDDQIETIQNKVAKEIKEDKFIGNKSEAQLPSERNPRFPNEIEQLALKESREQIKVVKQYAEKIAKWGIFEGRNKMPNKLTDIKISEDVVGAIRTAAGAIRTAMYNQAFIEISFDKGRELVEQLGKIPGGDEMPPPSSKIQPRAQPAIPAPKRSQ